jgi:hypothetical protein
MFELTARWRPNDDAPAVPSERLEWQPEAAPSALDIDLGVYFDRVLGLGG